MLAMLVTAVISGLRGEIVRVEVDVAPGLPVCHIVGLPDTALSEARERVRSAIRNSGFEYPLSRITVNLAPADRRKHGAAYDLAIALGILAASGQIRASTGSWALLGELSLGGAVQPVPGVLPMVATLRSRGLPAGRGAGGEPGGGAARRGRGGGRGRGPGRRRTAGGRTARSAGGGGGTPTLCGRLAGLPVAGPASVALPAAAAAEGPPGARSTGDDGRERETHGSRTLRARCRCRTRDWARAATTGRAGGMSGAADPGRPGTATRRRSGRRSPVDLADVRGQAHAGWALEVALAGGHNLLLVGPPGAGKTLLARTIPGLLPPLDDDEALEVTVIESVAGLLHEPGLRRARPFRAPHHTISYAALVGGGPRLQPGEVTLGAPGRALLG